MGTPLCGAMGRVLQIPDPTLIGAPEIPFQSYREHPGRIRTDHALRPTAGPMQRGGVPGASISGEEHRNPRGRRGATPGI